jgi:hypothetical protein
MVAVSNAPPKTAIITFDFIFILLSHSKKVQPSCTLYLSTAKAIDKIQVAHELDLTPADAPSLLVG